MTVLPEPSPVRDGRPPRRPILIVCGLAAVAMLVAASLVAFGSDDDDATSILAAQAAGDGPVTAQDADVMVLLDHDASDADVAAVMRLLDATSEVTAYTFATSDQIVAELRVLASCTPGASANLRFLELEPQLRIRVPDETAWSTLVDQLEALPSVTSVRATGAPPSGPSDPSGTTTVPVTASTAPAPTTTPVVTPTTEMSTAPTSSGVIGSSSTVVTAVPTTTPAPGSTAEPTTTPAPGSTAEPTTTSTVPPVAASPSKEIPFAVPDAPPCTDGSSGRTAPASPGQGAPAPPAAATLPSAGEPPSDPVSAEQAIRDMWLYTHDGSVPLEDRFRDHLEDADVLLPLMKSIGRDDAVQTTHILGVQFVSPTRAAVLSQNVFQGGSLDVAQVQYVVFVDGQWKWTRQSECAAIARAGVHCPEGP